MKLYEQKTTYNPRPLIEGAIDLSKFHFSQDWRNQLCPTANMVTIGLGRQTGQTTAIKEILLDNNRLRNETIVLTHNHACAKELFLRHGISAYSVQSFGSIRNRFEGRSVGIIFDVCSSTQITKFLNELFIPGLRIKFLVNVAPIL